MSIFSFTTTLDLDVVDLQLSSDFAWPVLNSCKSPSVPYTFTTEYQATGIHLYRVLFYLLLLFTDWSGTVPLRRFIFYSKSRRPRSIRKIFLRFDHTSFPSFVFNRLSKLLLDEILIINFCIVENCYENHDGVELLF